MVVGVLALSACGGNGSESVEIAILEDIDGVEGEQALEGGDGQTADGGAPADNFQDAILEFAACLRDQGLDVPDPDFSGGGGRAGLFGGAIDPQDPEVQAAIEQCQSAFEGIQSQFIPEDQTALQDSILEFASCLRDQGFDVPDPDFSGGGAGGGGFFRGNIDLDDPEVQAALEECQDFLPNRLPGND